MSLITINKKNNLNPFVFFNEHQHEKKLMVETEQLKRWKLIKNNIEYIYDEFSDLPIRFFSIRALPVKERIFQSFSIEGHYRLIACNSGGWLLLSANNKNPHYWLPRQPISRKTNNTDQILTEKPADIHELNVSSSSFSITIIQEPDNTLDLVCLEILIENERLIDELQSLSPIETQAIFLWGSHTQYTRPADLFLHLIQGYIYENRTAWPFYRKICSENDAHALFVTINGLENITEKKIYNFLKSMIIVSVIARQNKSGGWYHGEWSNDMESHFRLHCSGMHLLMDSLAIQKDPLVEKSLQKAARFISQQRDELDIGCWFLHDELELNEKSMQKSPFKWVKSNAFGKRVSNMLVLNTQLDATIALDRYAETTDDQQYAPLIESARKATKVIFNAKPAEQLYKLLFKIIRLTLLPTNIARKLPLHQRAIKRIGWKYLIPQLYQIKKIFPRINMPGGYIDRALTLFGISDAYQSINLMDITRYMRRFHGDITLASIAEAIEFTQNSGLINYWTENNTKIYALGFWSEALYHLCLLYPEHKYRLYLSETIFYLHERKLGIPPSFLGGNLEAKQQQNNFNIKSLYDNNVIIVNLGNDVRQEILMANPHTFSIHLKGLENYKINQSCKQLQDMQLSENTLDLPSRSWISFILV